MTLSHRTVSYRHFSIRRTVFCRAFVLFFAVFLISLPVRAEVVTLIPQQESEEVSVEAEVLETVEITDPYTVENIEIDVTADNAVEARESAFEAAQIKGYEMLAARFLSTQDLADFSTPDIGTISTFVEDYEVTNEQLSAVRYKATYLIRYSQRAFQGKVPQTNQSQSPSQNEIVSLGNTLVLPFYEIDGRTILWRDNPFLEAWARAQGNNVRGYEAYHAPIVPVGDIEDMDQLNESAPLNYDPALLNAMRLRYQAEDAVLLVGAAQDMPDGTTNLLIDIYEASSIGPQRKQQIPLQSFVGEASEQFYDRAVSLVSKKLKALKPAKSVKPAYTQYDENSSVIEMAKPDRGADAGLSLFKKLWRR